MRIYMLYIQNTKNNICIYIINNKLFQSLKKGKLKKKKIYIYIIWK